MRRPVLRLPVPRVLRRFVRDESGMILAEAMFVLPLLVLMYLGMFVFWEVHRAHNTNIKAAYTVADMVSRETATLNTAYINGLGSIHRYISNTGEATSIRVTHILYRASDDSYRVLWSRNTKPNGPQMTNAMLAQLRPRLPVMTDGDTGIIVEAERQFRPAFAMGIPPILMRQLVVTRPRFLSPIPMV